MKRGSLLALLLSASAANAQLTVTIIGDGYLPTDVSADGSVVVGNIYGPYETFYWTAETGPLPLGRATVPVLGVGAGIPGVSADGTKVSATILTDDESYATQGIWDITNGWQTLMPPPPADGGVLDQSYGSAWGISGDGNTLVGLYWRPGQSGGSAHPSAGTLTGGVLDLGTPGHSGRANAANFDGSVIGGWTERADGTWEPTVWVDGVRTVLGEFDASSTVEGVNSDGNIVVGESYQSPYVGATAWRWNGVTWDRDYVGLLPGAVPNFSLAWFDSVSADGDLMVGGTRPYFQPIYWGMVWMPDTGLIDADDWLAGYGVAAPFEISQFTAVSDDGRTVVGIASNYLEPPYELVGVVVQCTSDGDANGDGTVDLRDYAELQQSLTGAGAGEIPSGSEPLDMNCDLDIDLDDVSDFVGAMSGPAT